MENLFNHQIEYQKRFSLLDHLDPRRFMLNKHFVKEVRLKVEFSELSQKASTEMIQL